MQSRIRRLERWHTINTVLFKFQFLYICVSSRKLAFLSLLGFSWCHMLLNYAQLWQTFVADTLDLFYVCPCWLFTIPKETPLMLLLTSVLHAVGTLHYFFTAFVPGRSFSFSSFHRFIVGCHRFIVGWLHGSLSSRNNASQYFWTLHISKPIV